MSSLKRLRHRPPLTRPAHLLLLSGLAALASPAAAQPPNPFEGPEGGKTAADLGIHIEPQPERELRLEVGETRLLRTSKPIIRISVADPSVVDVQVVTPDQVLVTANAVGFTHLILWGRDNEPLVVAVSSARNLDQLRTQLGELFPGEELKVSAAGDLVVLSGNVGDLRVPSRAAQVASLYSEQIANLIEVTGDQQVQVEVRFAEVSRTGLRRIGMNFLWQDPSGHGFVGGAQSPETQAGAFLADSPDRFIPGTGTGRIPFVSQPVFQDAFSLFFSTGLADFPFSAILSILSQEGLAKVLAEPTLVALSGQDASFHVGGEIPILIAQQLGATSVRFKKFGIQLNFTPTVLGERTISLKLRAEVSEPESTRGGVVLGGFQIPSFRTRSSETTVRLKDGQSFAIAGLLSDNIRQVVNKIPVLGDIPILGALFRSTAFQREETELLVVVTARLVRPLMPDEVPPLPGEDEDNDPNDFELFLLGKIKHKKLEPEERRRGASHTAAAATSASLRGGPVGPLGFVRDR